MAKKISFHVLRGFPGGSDSKKSACNVGDLGSIPGLGRFPRKGHGGFPGGSDSTSICLQCRRPRFDPWVGKIPWRRKWQPTPVHLPGKFHGWRNLIGYSPWGHKESDTTERLHFHFHPLQYSCLENSMDRGAWWATVHGVE